MTHPPDRVPRWGNATQGFPLHSTLYSIKPMLTNTHEVAFVVEQGGRLILPPRTTKPAVLTELKTDFFCQYLPQDGGTLINSRAIAVLTPSVTGCKVFMMRAGDEFLTFHIDVKSPADAYKEWEKFLGVAQNMCDQYKESDLTGIFSSVDIIFEREKNKLPENILGKLSSPIDRLAMLFTSEPTLLDFCGGVCTDHKPASAKIDGMTFLAETVTAFVKDRTTWSLFQMPVLFNLKGGEPGRLSPDYGRRIDQLNPPDFYETLQRLAAAPPPPDAAAPPPPVAAPSDSLPPHAIIMD